MSINKTGIVGMGALGLLYGNHIAGHCGMGAVEYLMDEKRVEKYRDAEFSINGETFSFPVKDAKKAEPVDLLIIAVKYTGLKEAIEEMKQAVGPDTIIISVLNGITSEKLIGEVYGMDNIVYTVAQGMDAMKFGNSLNYTQMGKLHIGSTGGKSEGNLAKLVSFFDEIQLPYIVEKDILYRLWSKFMLNVGVNQTCMVYGTTYSGVLQKGESNRTLIAAMREVVALANAEGVALSEKDINQYIEITRTLNPNGTPSMGQDRINKKHSEVEMFAGCVIEMAAKHHIYVPTNEFLYDRVKEIETEY